MLKLLGNLGHVYCNEQIQSPNDLYCVEWDVKPYSTQDTVADTTTG